MPRRSRSATPAPVPARQTRSRAASAEPSFAPRVTRSRSGTLTKPSRPISQSRPRNNSTTNSKMASHKPTEQETSPPSSAEATRNAYGESRFAKEDVMMKEHADSLFKAKVIDQEQAARLSVPWHEKGVLAGPVWDEKYLDTSRKHDIEIMSFEKARKIQARKDAKMKKFLEDWEAGRIDDEGKPIARSGVISNETNNTGMISDETDSEVEIVAVKKKGLERVPGIKAPQLTPIAEEKSVLMATPLPTELKFTLLRATTPTRSSVKKPAAEAPASPSGPMPDYSGFGYYELIALCRQRGLSSGGDKKAVKARLEADDVAVRDETERKELCTYKNGAKKREYKTAAPTVPVPTKRKRSADEEVAKDNGGKKRKA